MVADVVPIRGESKKLGSWRIGLALERLINETIYSMRPSSNFVLADGGLAFGLCAVR